MPKKSSKTAHVLNLISPSKAEEPTPVVADTAPEAAAGPELAAAEATPPKAAQPPSEPQPEPAPEPAPVPPAPPEPQKSKPKAETMEGILHLSENTENLSLLIRDNLEKEFTLQNPPPQPFRAGSGVPVAEKPHAAVKEVSPIPAPSQPEQSPLLSEGPVPFVEEAELPEIPVFPAEPIVSEPLEEPILPIAQEPLEEPILPIAHEPLEGPILPIAHEPLEEPILPIAQEPLEEPILPIAQEPLEEPILPIAQEPLEEPILPIAQEPLEEPILPIAQEPLEEPILPVAEPVSAAPAEISEPAADDGEPAENKKFYYTNVYERIIKSCVVEYLERFGVCTCSRCVADTTALALTNLPSKYIVTDYDNVEPLLSLYEHKYEVAIMTELTKACFEIDAHPHHKI